MSKYDPEKHGLFSKQELNYQHFIYKCLKSRIKTWDDLTDLEIVLMRIYHSELFTEEGKEEFKKWIQRK